MKKNMAQALMYIDSWPGFVYYVPRKLPRFYHRDTRIYGSRALWRKIWHRRGCWRANSSEKAVARWSIGNIVIAVILEDLRIKPRDGSTTKRHMPLEEVTEGPIPGYTKKWCRVVYNKKRDDFVKKSIYMWPFFLGGKCAGVFLLFSALRMRDVRELDACQKARYRNYLEEIFLGRERAMVSICPPTLVLAYAFKINCTTKLLILNTSVVF